MDLTIFVVRAVQGGSLTEGFGFEQFTLRISKRKSV